MSRQQFPEPTVGALIFNPEGKVLLMKSHKWHHKYVLPGGHVELGEKLEEALRLPLEPYLRRTIGQYIKAKQL